MTPAEDSSSRSRGLTDHALRLVTREASRLPLFALSTGLQVWERTRGLRELVLRRTGEALEIAAHTPIGRLLPQQVLDDGADDEAERIASQARQARLTPVATPPAAGRTTTPARPSAAPAPSKPATPGRPEVTEAAREVGAPGAVTEEVEAITDKLEVDEADSRDDLPIPDFDNVSLGSLRGRLRSLSLEQLIVLREWEQAHAHRLPVMTLLDNRIAKISAQETTNGSGSRVYPSESATRTGDRAAGQAGSAAEDEGGTLRV
jgi:hypothetical protein